MYSKFAEWSEQADQPNSVAKQMREGLIEVFSEKLRPFTNRLNEMAASE